MQCGKLQTSGACGAAGGIDCSIDTDAESAVVAVYDSPQHKKRASPPSPRGPGPRRAPLVGVRGGLGGVRVLGGSRAPTPTPAGLVDNSGLDEGEPQAELQKLRLALAAAEEKNGELTAKIVELAAALAAALTSSAQQEDAVVDHIKELGALQQRCEGVAHLEIDDTEDPPAEPEAVPPPQRQETKALCGAPKPQNKTTVTSSELQWTADNLRLTELASLVPLPDDGDDTMVSPRSLGAALLPWSPRTQGAETALPNSPRSLAAAVPLPPSVRFLAAEVPLPDSPRGQGALNSPRPGGGWAGSEEVSSDLATALGPSPPESPRLGAAEREHPRGVGMAVSAAVRWLTALFDTNKVA
eukprot:TRINITY_DN21293_c0_g1_i1.p2 TRINITY_DN21293_c0_g1~~TRINITY_DN21293_c0_g1_i1.p2  ORF type:complete len:356 (+),score=120.10 TRINITY_DN21293_c0_g1_i1:92-1159(+)